MSFGKMPHSMQTTRLSGMTFQQAILGACVPVLWGTRRVSLNLITYTDFQSKKAKQQGGSGGVFGKGNTGFVYSATILGLACEGPVSGIDSVWDQQGMFSVKGVTETFVVPAVGPFTYTVNNNGTAVFNNDYGVGASTPFSVAINDFGDPFGPRLLTGNQNVGLTRVSGAPGPGQYSVSPTGTYTFNAAQAGQSMQVMYTFYTYRLTERQLASIPNSGPFIVTVQFQPEFTQDLGVQFYPNGNALTKVSGTPSVSGTYNPNGGNYKFAAADAGLAVIISYAWNNPATDVNAPTTLNLTLINGTQGQAPWAYLTSKHPGLALGYTGKALIGAQTLFLGYTPDTPNYSFELGAPLAFGGGVQDACPSDAINAVLTNTMYGIGMDPKWIDSSLQGIARNYWLANNFFISDYLNTQMPAAQVIGRYLEASQVAAFWSEGKLKFIPAGTASAVANGATYTPPTTPLLTIGDSDYIPTKGRDPITVDRVPWADAFNDVRIEWSVRLNNYDRDVWPAQDEAEIFRFGRRTEQPKSYSFLCTAAAVEYAANSRLQRLVGVKNTYQTTVKSVYSYLDPMDIIQIQDPTLIGTSATLPVRITKIIDDPKTGIQLTMEDVPYTVFNVSFYGKEPQQPSNDLTVKYSRPDATELLVIEVPQLGQNAQGGELFIYGTGQGTNWGGCDLFYSYDNMAYNYLATIRVPAKTGVLTATLPLHADPDTTDTLKVQVTSPDTSLISVPTTTADALVTLSALIDASGNLELISYANVALSASYTYSITYLRRGQDGTTPRAFPAGSLFVRMDEAGATFQYTSSFKGKLIYIKALSFNQYGQQEQLLSDVSPVTVTLGGSPAAFTTPSSAPILYWFVH